MDELENFPNAKNVIALTNHEYGYRMRIGNYRVLFDADAEVRIIEIQQVKIATSKLAEQEPIMDINPTILEANGKPAFVVLPYDEYLKLTEGEKPAGRIPADGTTPHEVMRLCVKNGWSMIRAWREHLALTQAEMARRLEIRQPSYAAMEAPDAKPKKNNSGAYCGRDGAFVGTT